jgi:hypothetical protein
MPDVNVQRVTVNAVVEQAPVINATVTTNKVQVQTVTRQVTSKTSSTQVKGTTSNVNIGSTGLVAGPQGTPGYTPIKGVDYFDGADGTDGASSTVATGTTTTGDAGSSASVSNSGTTSAAILDFTIPRGNTGDAGSDGRNPLTVSATEPSSPQEGDLWYQP